MSRLPSGRLSRDQSRGVGGVAKGHCLQNHWWCRTPPVCGLNLGTRERDSRYAPKAHVHDKDLGLGGEPVGDREEEPPHSREPTCGQARLKALSAPAIPCLPGPAGTGHVLALHN